MKRIHRGNEIEATVEKAKENMKIIAKLYQNIQNLVPKGAFYKYHVIWQPSTVKVSYI